MLVDSHAHLLYFPQEERHNIIERAKLSGVFKMLNISTKVGEINDLISSSRMGANIFNTVGTHPCNVHEEPDITHQDLIDVAISDASIVGFGETGLDYYHSTEHKSLQQKQFTQHIIASAKLAKPMIVHTRNADDDTAQMLRDSKQQFGDNLKIVIHCFTGNVEFCQKLLEIGCYISFSGIVTFKNAQQIKQAMLATPLERMLIETDSPFLAPKPMRGKQNEPAFVKVCC
jgi:TatD DNase family protein